MRNLGSPFDSSARIIARDELSVTLASVLLVLAFCAATSSFALARSEGANSSATRCRIELRELWRAGADESEVFFGAAGNPVVTDDGGVAVLDYQQSCVFAFSESGKLVKVVDLSGEGPGSVRYPACLIRAEEGGYALAHGFPASIELLDSEWRHSRSVPLYRKYGTDELRLESILTYRGGFIVIGENIKKEQNSGSFLFRRNNYVEVLSADGGRLGSVYSRMREVDFSDYDYVEDDLHYVHGAAVSPRGEIYVITERNGYVITVFGPDLRQKAVLTREYTPLDRPEGKMRYLKSHREAIFSRSFNRFSIDISENEPDLVKLEYTRQDELRVTTSRSYNCDEPDVYCRYDVFDSLGKFVRQDDIVLPVFEKSGGRLHWLDDDRILLITGVENAFRSMAASNEKAHKALDELDNDVEDDPMEIVVYEITWPSGRPASTERTD